MMTQDTNEKIGSRMLPATWQLYEGDTKIRQFKTAFKTKTVFGNKSYADIVMPCDLGIDEFEEDDKLDGESENENENC